MNNIKSKNHQTVVINPYYKEMYYSSEITPIREHVSVLEARYHVWNQLDNLSMQNAVVQMRKIA